MPRTVNQEDYSAKRSEIVDAALRLIYTKGYERMTIQDIRAELGMSNGAFFHYFDSKSAVLEAFIERMKVGVEKVLLPLIHDPHLTAVEKLQGFFTTLDQFRVAHKADVIELGRVWYADDNAIVRLKVDEAVLKQRAPLLSEIVHQGIREGVFTTPQPDQSGEIILSLQRGMSNTHASLMLSLAKGIDEARVIEDIVAVYGAYMDAIERVLGAPSHSLYRADPEAVKVWVTALRVST